MLKNDFLKKIYVSQLLLFLSFIVGTSQSAKGQNAYDHWLNSQKPATHLRQKGTYTLQEIYRTETGKRKDLELVQRQRYELGYLREDEGYVEGMPIYHVVTKLPEGQDWERLAAEGERYLAGQEVIGFNLLDSSTATYAFDEAGKLNYYVVDQQGSMHAIYTYNKDGHLLRYKDCMAPFNNSYWCAYYVYDYTATGQLIAAHSYNLAQGATTEEKELFAIDSMVYNVKGQLSERWTLDSAGTATQKAQYWYNEAGRLCGEQSNQWPISKQSPYYQKTYCYHNNGEFKRQEQAYYLGDNLQARQEEYYNRTGNLRRRLIYKRGKRPVSWYVVRYR
jgi:hypothetical protein